MVLPRVLAHAWVILLLFWLTGCSGPETRDLQAFVEATRQSVPGKIFEPLPEIEPYKPFIYAAMGLKDPFAVSGFVIDALDREREQRQIANNGVQPDMERSREELEQYALGSLKMVGTYYDLTNDALWALIKAPDGIVHRIREGNYVGLNFGEIYSVSEYRIDLQEIVPDENNGGWTEREAFLSLSE